jgi:hypothetical protein
MKDPNELWDQAFLSEVLERYRWTEDTATGHLTQREADEITARHGPRRLRRVARKRLKALDQAREGFRR